MHQTFLENDFSIDFRKNSFENFSQIQTKELLPTVFKGKFNERSFIFQYNMLAFNSLFKMYTELWYYKI